MKAKDIQITAIVQFSTFDSPAPCWELLVSEEGAKGYISGYIFSVHVAIYTYIFPYIFSAIFLTRSKFVFMVGIALMGPRHQGSHPPTTRTIRPPVRTPEGLL